MLLSICNTVIYELPAEKHGYEVELLDEASGFKWDLVVPLEPKQRDILKALGVVYKN